MMPIIVLVGRPNVGKSTLFNRLTKTRQALVANEPGLTRDRQYGHGKVGRMPYIVVDTAGLTFEDAGVDALMAKQTAQAIEEADSIIWLVDGKMGLTPMDETLAITLRKTNKSVVIAVNKVDGKNPDILKAEFYALGFEELYPIAAAHGRGVSHLMEKVLKRFEEAEKTTDASTAVSPTDERIKVAIVGRPNVGKSTLINRFLGEERVVVFDAPGTTRDSVFIPFDREGKSYTLIDTAGVRRRGRISKAIEKFSVIKTLQAIEAAHVVIVMIDASEGITDQDLHLIGFVEEAGKALVIAVNKWDGLTPEKRAIVKKGLDRRLVFVDYATQQFISARHGTGVGKLFPLIDRCYEAAMRTFSTAELTRILQQAQTAHQPPLVKGRRIKLRYAHAGGHNPPTIVIHGNQTKSLPLSYQRYLISVYRKAFKLAGTPIRLVLKTGDNPYQSE